MTRIEAQFERELEIFRVECETVAQFLYAHLAIHETARSSKRVFRFLNDTPLFWNTVAGGLQQVAFISLGRVFDKGSGHSVDKLLKLAQNNRSIFSRSALERRKQGSRENPPPWLDDYMQDVPEPRNEQFRKLRANIKKHRTIYEARYRDIRNAVVAHRETSDDSEVHALFAKTNLTELQRLAVFLMEVYSAFWGLFNNGHPLVLHEGRYSARSMVRRFVRGGSPRGVHERVVHEAARVLREAAGVERPKRRPTSRRR